MHVCIFSMGLVHYLRDSQVWISANFSLTLSPTALFTYLKIILLQCFQFSVFNNKRYPNILLVCTIAQNYISKRAANKW